jgi:hypothetical protein
MTTKPKPPARLHAKPAKPGKTQRLTVDIDKALHRKLKLAAVQNGQAISDIVRDLLEEHLRVA